MFEVQYRVRRTESCLVATRNALVRARVQIAQYRAEDPSDRYVGKCRYGAIQKRNPQDNGKPIWDFLSVTFFDAESCKIYVPYTLE